jgi:TolB protein
MLGDTMKMKFKQKFVYVLLVLITIVSGDFFLFRVKAQTPIKAKIAFVSDRDQLGQQDIYVMDEDGQNVVSLTNNESNDRYPSWSPDGCNIAFFTTRDGNGAIYVMDSHGANSKKLTNGEIIVADVTPNWSPDGQQLVFTSPCTRRQDLYRNSSLYLIRSDGTGLTPLLSMPGGDYDPAWSPDGKTIAFTSLRDGNSPHIYLYDLSTNQVQRFTSLNSSDSRPAWSPDGQFIACESTALGKPQIWLLSTTSNQRSEFSQLDDFPEYAPAWSQDGKVIYFSQGSSQSYIMAKRTDQPGAKEIRISDRVKTALSIASSPDDFWLAFESWTDGNHDIYTMSRTGANLTRLTNEPGIDMDPVWQP